MLLEISGEKMRPVGMAEMKICVCDSDIITRVKTYNTLKAKFADVKDVLIVCSTPYDILFDIEDEKFDYDVFITDIIFIDTRFTGVELVKKINGVAPLCKCIYYTDQVPGNVDIYETKHFNCVIKGIQDSRLEKCITEIINEAVEARKNNTIKIKFDRSVNIIECSKIRFIRIENRVTKFYTDKEVLYEYKPLSQIQEELPDNFIRCHNAIIVNRNYIKKFNRSVITLDDGEKLKIGRRYVSSFSE